MHNPYSADQYPDLSLAMTPDCSPEDLSLYPQAKGPTFTTPSLSMPTTRPYDLQAPGIDYVGEMESDPYTGDLLQFDEPAGLAITAASDNALVARDPMLPDTEEYDRPDNLMIPSPMTVDPSMPDLQSPDLEQEVHMVGRPGEMGDSDGEEPDLEPDGDNDDDDGPMPPYDEEYQTPGMSHRQRKQDMLYRGLRGLKGEL